MGKAIRHVAEPVDLIPVADLASYIAETSGELALLAGRARWPLLSYFLNMARIEAEARIALDLDVGEGQPLSVRRTRTRVRSRIPEGG